MINAPLVLISDNDRDTRYSGNEPINKNYCESIRSNDCLLTVPDSSLFRKIGYSITGETVPEIHATYIGQRFGERRGFHYGNLDSVFKRNF